MQISYTDIFKHSDVLNPISPMALFSAGKLAELNSEKKVLDLGSGKGFPSLLWASTFGVQIESFDINKDYVEYSNSRAKLLGLSGTVKYFHKDIKSLSFIDKYDAVACLGLGITEIFGITGVAMKSFKRMLRKDGFLILAEPVWLTRPVPEEIQKRLQTSEEALFTRLEMESALSKNGFEVVGSFVSSKEDWEFYICPVNVTMFELMRRSPELEVECQKVMDGFEAEYQAAERYWNMVLWVARSH